MKTNNLLSILALFFFMTMYVSVSANTQPNTIISYSTRVKTASNILVKSVGEPIKSKKSPIINNDDKSFLINAPVETEISFDYLKFDVNKYIDNNEPIILDLPASDFNYLRFDVNDYIQETPVSIEELPEGEFDYLKFDVNQYIKSDNKDIEDISELQ
jgi:hypothetical protein